MSIHGASHIKCVACDLEVPLLEARSQWWICTTCGSYICPSCHALYLETSQRICPGTIVRGVEAHQPHFTRFLLPRHEAELNERSRVIILGDVKRRQPLSLNGKVIILDDDETDNEEQNETNGQ